MSQLPEKTSKAPSDEQCFAWWEKLKMLPHIREHSLLVAQVASRLCELASQAGHKPDAAKLRASALLHDIAKTYTISYGGNHSQLGASWCMELTGDARLAQGVAHHVFWPWEIDAAAHFLPLCVIYSDKRVKHNRLVSVEDRFKDLFARYGTTQRFRERIELSLRQSLEIEKNLSQYLGIDLNAYSFDSRRLV